VPADLRPPRCSHARTAAQITNVGAPGDLERVIHCELAADAVSQPIEAQAGEVALEQPSGTLDP